MNREQINHIYAQAPVLLWPWVWVQLVVILARLEAASMRGEDSTVLIGITHWFRLDVLYVSDNLSGYAKPETFSYEGKVTFASLCEPITATWTPFDSNNITFISANDTICATIGHSDEYADALRAVP